MSDLITGKQAPNFRAITGPVPAIEVQLNELLEEYVANQIYWSVIDGKVHLSALLIHTRIVNRRRARGETGHPDRPELLTGATQLGVINVNADTVPRQ